MASLGARPRGWASCRFRDPSRPRPERVQQTHHTQTGCASVIRPSLVIDCLGQQARPLRSSCAGLSRELHVPAQTITVFDLAHVDLDDDGPTARCDNVRCYASIANQPIAYPLDDRHGERSRAAAHMQALVLCRRMKWYTQPTRNRRRIQAGAESVPRTKPSGVPSLCGYVAERGMWCNKRGSIVKV